MRCKCGCESGSIDTTEYLKQLDYLSFWGVAGSDPVLDTDQLDKLIINKGPKNEPKTEIIKAHD